MNILSTAIQSGTVESVALCDVDQNQIDAAAKRVEEMTGSAPKKYKDYRELLEEQKPEIAIVATPDHWHPLAMIEACKAGAHVYVEKPVCHTILEGAAMVKTARDTNRVVQVGTHRRVSPHNVSGMKFLKEGKAGKIGMVRAFVHYGGGPGENSSRRRRARRAGLGFLVRSGAAATLQPQDSSQGFSQLPRLCQRHAGRLGHPLAGPDPLVDGREVSENGLFDGRSPDLPRQHGCARFADGCHSSLSRSRRRGSIVALRPTMRRSTISVSTSTARKGRSTWGGATGGRSIR